MTASAPQPHARLLARNTLLNLLGMGAPMVAALVAVPLLVTGLGAERFGVLAIAWLLLATLGELGFGSTTTKFTAEALGSSGRSELGSITWTTGVMQTVVGLAEGVALLMAAPWLVERAFSIPPELWPEALRCFHVLALALPVIGLSRSVIGVLEAGQRFDLITAVRLPATLASYLLPLAGLALGWGLPVIFGLIVLSRVAALCAYGMAALSVFRDVDWRPRFHRGLWRAMLRFGGWTTVSGIISPLLGQLDRLMVGVLLSMAAVSYYAAPYEVVARLSILPMAVVGTLYPAFSQIGGGGDWKRVRRMAARAVKMIMLAVAPLALLLVGGAADGLAVWLGAEFARESTLAVQILGFGVFINASAHVPYVLLQSSGRPDVPAKIHLLELPLHLLLTWLFVSRWGISGAAAAWTLRVSLDAALLFAAAHRLSLLRFADMADEKTFRLVAVAAAAAVVVLMAAGADAALPRLALLGLALLGTAGAMWRFGIQSAERTRIVTLLRPSRSS